MMGAGELRNIREGLAPESGRGVALAGMILGIIGTILLVISIVTFVASILLGLRSLPKPTP
jgi:uncharacterized membrane protein